MFYLFWNDQFLNLWEKFAFVLVKVIEIYDYLFLKKKFRLKDQAKDSLMKEKSLEWKRFSNEKDSRMKKSLEWKRVSNEKESRMKKSLEWKRVSNEKESRMRNLENSICFNGDSTEKHYSLD